MVQTTLSDRSVLCLGIDIEKIPKPPQGFLIEVQVSIDGTPVPVINRDFEWNHSLYCWQCTPEELATIVACRAFNLELPPELARRHRVMKPDLGREHVRFMVNGQSYDFSLYGLVPVILIPDV